jgi:hypothetical protein
VAVFANPSNTSDPIIQRLDFLGVTTINDGVDLVDTITGVGSLAPGSSLTIQSPQGSVVKLKVGNSVGNGRDINKSGT